MAFISGLLVGVILSAFAIGLLCILLMLHRPAAAPTFHNRRKWRDALPEVRNEPPPMPVCKPAKVDEVGGIEYRFMGQTGEEV